MHRFLTTCPFPVLFAVAALFVSTLPLTAQTPTTLSYARAENGIIAVLAEESTGQYRIEAADGTPLLFRSGKGVTGYVNIHVRNNTFTNNLLHRPSLPPGERAMERINVEELADRVRITAFLRAGSDSLRFMQDLIPSMDGDYAYINSVVTLENLSLRPVTAGALMMLDIMIGARDTVDLMVDGESITHEREWRSPSIPAEYTATAEGSPYTVIGRLRSSTADPPDHFVAGNWQFNGYLGTAVWNYTPSGLKIIDDAVLLQWDALTLQRGETRTVRTDYGVTTFPDVALTCRLPELVPAPDSSSFSPWPIPATANVRNTGTTTLTGIDVRITLPAELRFVPGETAVKTVAGPIPPGGDEDVTWLLYADTVDVPTAVEVDFEIVAPAELTRFCRAGTVIPPLSAAVLTVDCGDTIRLGMDPEGGAYLPDPFTISAFIRNPGNRSLTNLIAEITLPPGVVLVSGSTTVPVVPDPLLPGAGTIVNWTVRGILQPVRTVAPYTIRVTAAEAQAFCENAVILPPYNPDPCIEPGVNTAGQAFWMAFLPDVVGTGQESLRIYISAPEQSNVTIRSTEDNSVRTLQVPAGGLRMAELPRTVNVLSPEYTTRKGIEISSDHPVHVFAGNFRDRHTDAFTVLPVHALGTRYVTAGYNFPDAHEHFTIVATEDDTRVTITPSAFTSTQRPSGQPFDVTLDAGDVYYVKAFLAGNGGSLTGSIVDADKPVAVFSGAESGWIPTQGGTSGFLNPAAEQMIPLRFLGTEYVAVPFRSRFLGDTYRIVATEDMTTVTVGNKTPVIYTRAGEWTEDLLHDPTLITADKPIMIAQYANSALWDHPTSEYGDGSMLVLVPTDRHMSCHYFPAGTLVADVEIIPNRAASIPDGSWLQVDDTPAIAAPVFTAECWIQLNGNGVIVSRTADADERWKLEYEFLRGRLAFVTEKGGNSTRATTPDNSLFQGMWTHVALVVNGPAGTARVYINGNEELSTTFPPMRFERGGGLAWAGVHNDATQSQLWCTLDECRYWGMERTPQQIADAMHARIPELARGGMLGYWPFCNGYDDETLFRHDLDARGSIVLQETYGLPSTLNCSDQLDSNFVNIVVPVGGEAAVTVNYTPLPAHTFSTLAGSNFSWARLWLPTGINRIETSDPRGLGATSYGFAYHDAYTTYTGYRVSTTTRATVSPRLPASPVLHDPSPQPVRGAARLRFDLPARSQARLFLTDMLGREWRVLHDGVLDSGGHERTLHAGGLPAGTYLLHLRTAEASVVRRILVIP
ncbi:MAG: hypothetical protein JXA28_12005 [Bacteroidetes bacterium]|nr:hypothetical protein [Bacteroidota bacterium]